MTIIIVMKTARQQRTQTIKARREARGDTMRQVATSINVTERTYQRWESEEVRPDGANLLKLADYFGVHPRDLFPEADLATKESR